MPVSIIPRSRPVRAVPRAVLVVALLQGAMALADTSPVAQDKHILAIPGETSYLLAPSTGIATTQAGTAQIVTAPSHGTATVGTAYSSTSQGSFKYIPTVGYAGPDSFTFTVSDGTTTSNVATVSILVRPSH